MTILTNAVFQGFQAYAVNSAVPESFVNDENLKIFWQAISTVALGGGFSYFTGTVFDFVDENMGKKMDL